MSGFRVTDERANDLKGIYRYIALDNRPAAIRQMAALYQRFDLLGTHPLLGEPRPDLAANLRTFVVGNYVIVYRPADAGVQIARVIHAARDIGSVF